MLLADADIQRPAFVCQVVAEQPAAETPAAASDTPLAEASATDGDPWEGANRGLYGVHNFIDRVALRPAAMTYKHVLPRPVRSGVRNFISNLDEPRVFINDMLQGRLTRAGQTALRFITNSTIGIAGLFDVAKRHGLPGHDNDFGITMGRAHVGPGPYMFVPLLGPTNVRDLVGAGVDLVFDPFNWAHYRSEDEIQVTLIVAEALDTRAELDRTITDVNTTSVDPYATVRSFYMQSRQSEINGGAVNLQDLPEFPDFGTPTPEAAPPADRPPRNVQSSVGQMQ